MAFSKDWQNGHCLVQVHKKANHEGNRDRNHYNYNSHLKVYFERRVFPLIAILRRNSNQCLNDALNSYMTLTKPVENWDPAIIYPANAVGCNIPQLILLKESFHEARADWIARERTNEFPFHHEHT